MKAPHRRKLVMPATLAVTVLAPIAVLGLAVTGAACATSTTETTTSCVPVLVPDAGVRTFACKDGRQCDAPDPAAIDGGIDDPYQICPGPTGDCATLVAYDGGSEVGYC